MESISRIKSRVKSLQPDATDLRILDAGKAIHDALSDSFNERFGQVESNTRSALLAELRTSVDEAVKTAVENAMQLIAASLPQLVADALQGSEEKLSAIIGKSMAVVNKRLDQQADVTETRINQLQETNEKSIGRIEGLLKTISSVDGNEGIDFVNRGTKMLETRFDKRLQEEGIANARREESLMKSFENKLLELHKSAAEREEGLQKSYETQIGEVKGWLETLRQDQDRGMKHLEGILQAMPVPNVVLPESAIRVELNQQPFTVNVPEQQSIVMPAPQVTVNVPEQQSIVNVPQQLAPQVVVNVPKPRRLRKEIIFDEATGRPVATEEIEVEDEK